MTISVIIPTYNRRDMLARALDSVLAQQGADAIEIIVVDDGSTDGTADFIRQQYQAILIRDGSSDNLQPSTPNLQPSHFNLILLQQPNRGAPVARNLGLREARGDYIALLDSDDELTPDSLAVRAQALEANPGIDLVCGDYQNYVDGVLSGPTMLTWLKVLTDLPYRTGAAGLRIIDDFFDAQLRQPITSSITLMLRRSAMCASDTFDEALAIGQDWEFALRFLKRHRGGILPVVVARRHFHGANLVLTRKHGADAMLHVDRKVLAYEGLTVSQRNFMRMRLADNQYECARDRLWQRHKRWAALQALLPSLGRRITWPKLKLLLACCLPWRLAGRLRRHGGEQVMGVERRRRA